MSSRINTIRFCMAYLLSAFGYEFILFVLTVHVYNLTGNALNVGIFMSLSFFARLLSPCYGLITDRCDKRRLLAWASFLMGSLAVVMGFAGSIAWIYSLWFVASLLAMVIMNVRSVLRVEIMDRDSHLFGNSVVLVILNTARIGAPLIGGLFAAFWSARSLLYLTGGIYFATTAACFFFEYERINGSPRRTARSIVADLRDGARFIARNNHLGYLAIMGICWRLFLGLQVPLFVVFVKSFLEMNDTAYGLFLASIGIGSILGSIMGPKLAKKTDAKKMINFGLGSHYLLFALLGLTQSFYSALVLVFAGFVVFYATVVAIHSIRDEVTRVDVRGRVYGSINAILAPPGIISMVVGSYLAGVFGVEKVFLWTGILGLVSMFAVRAALFRPPALHWTFAVRGRVEGAADQEPPKHSFW